MVNCDSLTLKVWNINNNYELLFCVNHLYKDGAIYSCCFINNNKEILIASSNNCSDKNKFEPVKI